MSFQSTQTLQNIEQIASGNTFLHRFSPTLKLVFTLIYIVCVVSVPRYEITMLVPFLWYPVVSLSFFSIPLWLLLKRLMQTLPLVFFIGVSSLWLDSSGGAIALSVLLLKAILTVSAVMILAATTSVNMLAGALRQLHVPCIIILQILLTWRYLELLANEGATLNRAYLQRNPKARMVKMIHLPMLLGSLLLRSIDRADRIYNAMQCRGFHAGSIPKINTQISLWQMVIFMFLGSITVAMRKYDVCNALGELIR